MLIEFLQQGQNMWWAALALVSGAMLIWPLFTGGDSDSLSPAAATLMMNREDAVVLDVRESSEWASGHIAGARHIALAQLDKRITELDKLKAWPLIVCCARGSRSRTAMAALKKAGFEKVFVLEGGVAAWLEANLPVTRKG